MIKILLMEDDLDLCQSIQQALKKEGYSVDCCNDGESSMIYALNTDYGYDLAIVDRMLPIIDGLTIIKAMRRKQIQIPVIIITGMSALDDRVDGLDSGADDYLIKPFHIRELMARVRALTRRPQQIQEMGMLSYADLHFDYPNRKVTCNGQELILTAKETELLSVLMKQPETSFSREQLVFDLTDLEYISSAGLRVLLKVQKYMNKKGDFKLTHVSEVIEEIFEITGFSDILTIE